MLDRAHRLTGSQAFSTALRQGYRAGTSTLVVHLTGPSDDPAGPPRVGLVVSRGVGRAVNPQHRASDEPRPGDYLFEGYELQDALDKANECLEDDVSVAEGDGDMRRQPPFRRSEILGPLERWFFGRR